MRPFYDGKRWRLDNAPKQPPEGFATFADVMRWLRYQRELEDLL